MDTSNTKPPTLTEKDPLLNDDSKSKTNCMCLKLKVALAKIRPKKKIIVYGGIILFAVIFFICFLSSLLPCPQPPNDFVESVGDQNTNGYSQLILNPSAHLVTVRLMQPQNATVNIYVSSLEPAITTQHFPQISKDKLIGRHRYNYNYYGANQSIYLLPNSRIIYMMNISSNKSSTCPTKLYLFDNVTSYLNFKNYGDYMAVAISPCLMENTKSLTKVTWIFNITKQGSYYVGIDIDTGIAITSNVSVVRVYYNIMGLESPSECSQPLSADHLSCQITLCSKFFCNRGNKYLLVNPTGKAEVFYSFSGPIIDELARFILFVISLTALISMIISIIACCTYSQALRLCKSERNVSRFTCAIILYIAIVLSTLVAFNLGVITIFLHHSTSGLVELERSTYNRPMLVTSSSFKTATSINFTILNPGSKSAALYQTSCNNLTLLPDRSLPPQYISQLSPDSFIRDGYNYDIDVPINLAPGSSLTYIINAKSLLPDPGCLSLYLFDSYSAYNLFLHPDNNTLINYVAQSRCVNVSTSGPPAQTIIVFNITDKQANYYVAFETPGHIAFDANISVIQTYYDTNGFKMPCSYHLSSRNSSCVIDKCLLGTPDRFCFEVKKDNICFLIVSINSVSITYEANVAFFTGARAYTFVFSMCFTFFVSLVWCLLLGCCMKTCDKRMSGDSICKSSYDQKTSSLDLIINSEIVQSPPSNFETPEPNFQSPSSPAINSGISMLDSNIRNGTK